MKICVAQTNPVKGNIAQNIENHQKLIRLAVSHGAGFIVFPELSLTGYEPALASDLATDAADERLYPFQVLSNAHQIIIGVGLPVKTGGSVAISMVIFQPQQPRLTYSKKWIHTDEEPYFKGTSDFSGLLGGEAGIALAICYELSVPEHAERAFHSGAKVYLASVSKTVGGIDKALDRLSEIARTYSMTVLMSNQVGLAEGQACAGKTSIWKTDSALAAQLDGIHEGILMIDTETDELIQKLLDSNT